MQPDDQPTTPQPPEPPHPAPRRLFRSKKDRVLGGVAGGLAEYFGIDPIITRLAFVGLTFVGGAGILLYVAALLLVPNEGEDAPYLATTGRTATIAGVVVLFLAAAVLLDGGWWWGGGALAWILGLGLIGLAAWWLATGRSPAGSGTDVMRRIGLGLALLALCFALAVGAFWAAAAGGVTVVAIIVIAAGAAMVAAAFAGGARWLILPALAVALPAAFVAAADIDTSGGIGDRTYRPVSAEQVRDRYELGVGELVVDLRDAGLPPGDRRMSLRIGAGQAVVIVPDDVCVASTAQVGAGEVRLFERHEGGLDLDFDEQPPAPAATPRLIVDADVGVGSLQFRHSWPAHHGPDSWDAWRDPAGRDTACARSTA
jgi:phage shock protein PspC (stress-responsive transcriptional regulator)